MNNLFKNVFNNIQRDEENFEYKLLTSIGLPEMYNFEGDDKIINAHLLHIIEDMNDEGWYLVACEGKINDGVIGYFLFQRKRVKQ